MKELLNSMHEDLNRVKGKPNYKQLSREVEGCSLPVMAAAFWEYYKLRDDSYIYDSLCGQLYNNIKCINCDHQSESFENFLDLSVPMVPAAKSLEDLLDSFFFPEKLADFYMCGECGKSAKKSTKTVELWRVPRFLIIQLKRPQFGKKNTEPITVPESLSLRKFMG
jgi:ubiquitin C-terminal hydrolase